MSLLSLMPGMLTWGGMMQAPATTGPARGPRPASSIPAQMGIGMDMGMQLSMSMNVGMYVT